MLSESADVLSKIEPIQEVKLQPMQSHALDTIICAQCGAVESEGYARVQTVR